MTQSSSPTPIRGRLQAREVASLIRAPLFLPGAGRRIGLESWDDEGRIFRLGLLVPAVHPFHEI